MYFNVTQDSQRYRTAWEDVVRQIQNWPPHWQAKLRLPLHHIEAKGLHIFTLARRLIRAAVKLANAENNRWQLIFVEASSLLFPMIELVGEARKDHSSQRSSSNALGAGIHWLRDPNWLPPAQTKRGLRSDSLRLDTLLPFMNRSQGPQVSDLYYLRNYYLHGTKNLDGQNVPIADIINFELPQAIARYSEEALRTYWQRLKQDDGSQEWVNRLAGANIRPFAIQGSTYFEAGLIDPDIAEYLENPNRSVFFG